MCLIRYKALKMKLKHKQKSTMYLCYKIHRASGIAYLLGNVLLSQVPANQVPSALEGLTVVFEMGTCGSPPPSPPNGVSVFCFKTAKIILPYPGSVSQAPIFTMQGIRMVEPSGIEPLTPCVQGRCSPS